MTSRRTVLAGFGGSFLVGAPFAETKVQAQTLSRDGGDVPQGGALALDPRAFGAELDGLKSDSAAFQGAVASLAARTPFGGSVAVDSGAVLLTTPIELAHYTTLNFGRAEVQLRPTSTYSIGVGLEGTAFSTTISGRLLQLHGGGKTAISVRNGAGFQLLGCDIDLKSEGQTGLLVAANDDPLGPYNGLVDNVRVNGAGLPGQSGIVLKQKPANGSIGVNRWIFNNLRHIASLEVGMDLQGTDGLIISNVNLESCHGSAIRFGSGSRSLRGRILRASGHGGFGSSVFVGMPLDPIGAIEVLSGRNRGESMVVTTITAAGDVLFPAPFPHAFEAGDEFQFTESKCRSVTVTNATYEGGSNDEETAFDFQAGARSCRVEVAFLTMARGNYFRRAIEDLSNTIARETQVIRLSLDLDASDGIVWLPTASASASKAGYLVHEPSWIEAVFVTAEQGNAGVIETDVVVGGRDLGLTARLTPDNPSYARRIRRVLPANSMMGTGTSYAVRVRKSGLKGPERINIEVVLGIL